ncbi:hypothetical protein FJZ31_12635 [Candidatus Poribacteria bacterium]|nr:hypothetical protein [Candidatus Poribacteria bacterium]
MKIKLAVISDTHFSSTPGIPIPSRKREFGDIFLNRAVQRINRFIKPDITLLLGDLVDDAQKQDLEVVKKITDGLQGPRLVIPGNHDGNQEQFFAVFSKLPDYLDIAGYRFVPFCDADAPDYNATRSEQDLERMKRIRQGYNGPIIAIQHVPLFPPGKHECPYNLTNAETALQIMKEADIQWVIAGHYHSGFKLQNGLFSVATPALCEKPFRFLEINIDGQETQVIEHQLSLPAELQLNDVHIHSHYAYCNENMDFQKALELAELFNLSSISFTEHSPHLYFTRENCDGAYLHKGLKGTKELISSRISEYYDEAKKFVADNVLLGLEVDCDFNGRPVVFDEDRNKFNLLLGAMHNLPPEVEKDEHLAATAFLTILEKFLGCGIQILAHPFRVFRRSRLKTPEHLFPDVVRLLKEHNIAAELNFHTNEPPLKFVEMCLEEGVKFAFGSDAHNLYEVGEFYPNIRLLQEAGYTGNLEDILYPFPQMTGSM